METLEDRIRSRFEWGLIADIGTPDYETRMAILRRKVEADDMKLSDEILNYIATNIKSNIRELEGALNKLLAYSNLEKTDITMDIAMKELQNIITPDKPREITPQLVIEVVTEHFNISLDQMISKNRSNEIARPRQIAMYLCNGGGLVERGVDAGQCRHVHNGTVAGALPDVRKNIDRLEVLGLGHKVDRRTAKGGDQLVDQAAGRRKQGAQNTDNDHSGDEVG